MIDLSKIFPVGTKVSIEGQDGWEVTRSNPLSLYLQHQSGIHTSYGLQSTIAELMQIKPD